MDTPIKPPIGVLPRKLYRDFLYEDILINGGMCMKQVHEQRLEALSGAISRYAEAKLHIDPEWVNEYNYTLEALGIVHDEFKL